MLARTLYCRSSRATVRIAASIAALAIVYGAELRGRSVGERAGDQHDVAPASASRMPGNSCRINDDRPERVHAEQLQVLGVGRREDVAAAARGAGVADQQVDRAQLGRAESIIAPTASTSSIDA